MANQTILTLALMTFTCLNMMSTTLGREVESSTKNASCAESETSGGFRTDRIAPRQQKVWKAIEQLIQAVDRCGKPRYPRLLGLWRWAQSSEHAIYIELLDEKSPSSYNAGFVTVQGSTSGKTQAIIQIWLRIIEQASSDERGRRRDGFIPFEGLGKVERYAEVVGHELAHAALQLENPEYARLCRELETEKVNFLASKRKNREGNAYDQTTLELLARLKTLTEQVEQPAQTAEVEIWRELIEGQKNR
jgi:hypothetical protein